ncbi:MAG: PilT/PilU family type 4a pilus ATPase [Patescibacteria group bacterium]|nr:PilT/PilU family type 4a pilus ATPase [Patescibacteria group bacterium]
MDIFQIFNIAIERQASDLHLIPNFFPTIRVNGKIFQLKILPLITHEDNIKIVNQLLSKEQLEILLTNKEIDFGYQYKEFRFRCNAYFSKKNLCFALRLLNNKIKTIEELNLPPFFHQFSNYQQGLILITGPTGEGKSTTLTAVINEINLKFAKHIITIEDPIEYVYPSGQSIISQRELHHDTLSWNFALKSALREDPDVVLVGEMRDYESIQLALTIAETGHLVFSTLHTNSAPETINRIIDAFPSHQQNQIRTQLSTVLKAVVNQKLIPTVNNTRIPCVELLTNNPAVSNIIREGKIHLLENEMLTGQQEGMILFEKYLFYLYQKGIITKETAWQYALRTNEIKKLIK